MLRYGRTSPQKNAAGRGGPSDNEMSAPESSATESGVFDVRGVIVIWDMENCAIPVTCKPSQICQNIESAIGSVENFYIFCGSGIVNQRVGEEISKAGSNATIEYPSSGVADYGGKVVMISKIHYLAAYESHNNHFLFITGDVDFCTTLSMLRQQNFTVGVACLPNSSRILKWAASYVLNWQELALGVCQFLVEPRPQLIMADDDRNKNPIYIYWDTDTCIIPDKIRCSEESMSKLTEKFQNLLRKNGYNGHFKVFTYGDGASVSPKNQQILQANFMSFQPVPVGNDSRINARVNAVKMIQTDVSARMLHCHCKNCFMIISNGDVTSLERLVKLKNHELVVVRSMSSDFESMQISF